MLELFNKNEHYKNKKIKKGAYLPKDTVACGLAYIKQNGDNFEVIKYKDAICKIDECDVANDLLADVFYKYLIYQNFNEAIEAIKKRELNVGEKFCFSMYDCYKLFPELKFMKTKEEVKAYLKEYNRINNTILYWTFLDDEEIKEVNEIADANEKKLKLYY